MKILFSRLGAFIALAAACAAGVLVTTLPSGRDALAAHGAEIAALLAVTLLAQTWSVRVSSRGSISVSSVGILATGFALGAGPAMLVALAAALAQWIRRRGLLHRAIFDAANFSLSAAIGAGVFRFLAAGGPLRPSEMVAGALAGAAYCLVNTGLLCCAMGLSERLSPLVVWRERFQWATPHYLACGPLAFASVLAYQSVGPVGFAVVAVPYAAALFTHRRLAFA
jgi:hypothetical protein